MIKTVFVIAALFAACSGLFFLYLFGPVVLFYLKDEDKVKNPKSWKKDDERRAAELEKRGWR
ncbi:MAG: hypothetical protein IJB97_05415 [Clostridia bacterium]|nr:hypothetical protein [Clostridia bacterium]